MRPAVGTAVALVLLGTAATTAAQPRGAAEDRWQATAKSMTDLLQDGFQLVSVVAPNPQLRIFFLGKPGAIAKCSEEAKLTEPPSAPNFNPRSYAPQPETRIECSQLTKSR